ncbi:MAG: glycosyltransferase family 39 protein [Planctomycetes bacterium]|nr:glycosyltransferase family 39 protein [Planctomycetota bacterium]
MIWFGLTPHEVGTSWRECDTMAIARNFLVDGFDPMRPRVDWRGDTDGAVECEFPLYQLMVATALAVFGEVEWPARLLSLLALVAAGFALHRLLEWRSGPGPALAGTLVFLTGSQAVLLAARVQPDGLSIAFALAGLVAYLHFLGNGNRTSFWLGVAALTIGTLQKAPTLQIVGLLGLWTAALAPRRLLDWRIWTGFAICTGALAAWLWHGAQLHAETGLTFGVLSAGETKFPGLRQLRDPQVWWSLIETTTRIGFSPLGCLAMVVLAIRRRFDILDWSLLAIVGAGLVGSLRYSAYAGTGPHYHVYAAIAGAFFVARCWPERAPWWLWALLLAAVGALGTHWLGSERDKLQRSTNHNNGTLQLAASIQREFEPTDLAIVRGWREGYDPYWKRRTNYEQPILLYQARRRGWVVPRDGFEIDKLAELKARGARFVVNPFPKATDPEVEAWLDEHGERVLNEGGSVVYRLE